MYWLHLQNRTNLLSIALIFITVVKCFAQNEVEKKQNIFPISLDSLTRIHTGSQVIDYSILN